MRAGGSGKGGGGGRREGGPRSAYRRICLLDRRIGVFAPGSAYRRIFRAYRRIFPPDRHISASGVPAYARNGVSQPRPPTVISAYRRMCPLRAMRRRISVSAQGGFATLFAGTLRQLHLDEKRIRPSHRTGQCSCSQYMWFRKMKARLA